MSRRETLDQLRSFYKDFAEHQSVFKELWAKSPGDGYLNSATPKQKKRLAELRPDLAVRYGRLRAALAEPQGGIPKLGNAYVFSLALADPVGNPFLFQALDSSVQTAAIAVGHFEQHAKEDVVTLTSPVYWWRRSRTGLSAAYKEIKDWFTIIAKLKP